MSAPLVRTRKEQSCRICGENMRAGIICHRWTGISPGDGWWTSHAHVECYELTKDWDEGDWESHYPGDTERPVIGLQIAHV